MLIGIGFIISLMNYDIRLALMCGSDIPIPECGVIFHQPSIKEIALIGENDFFIGVQTLCINKNMIMQGETLLSNTSNFQIFMTIMQEKETADKKDAIKSLFSLIFPNQKLIITPRGMVLSEGENSATIDETNFDFLQQVSFQAFCINTGPMDTQTFNPANEKAKEIADKLMRARQRVAEQKGGNGSIFSQYISTLTVGLNSMNIENCCNLTMYQLFDLVERYMLWVNWDLDVKSRLAGGKPDKQPDNWMKNIH